jgi:hypothetical protein
MASQTPTLRKKRNPQELRDASEHLLYELGMLDRLAHLLALSAFGEGPVANALLESFAMHARNLLQFFDVPEKPREDDVLAEDYFGSSEAWESVRGAVPSALRGIAVRVGKEVAHLTYARLKVTEEVKGWRFLEIASAVIHLARQFEAHVDPAYLGPGFRVAGGPNA